MWFPVMPKKLNGQSLPEYALTIALISLVGLSLSTMGETLRDFLTNFAGMMP